MTQKSGWNHVYEKNYMQYFVSNNNSNSVPIHTQPDTEFEAIKTTYKKFEMPYSLIIVFVMLFMYYVTKGDIIRDAFSRFPLMTWNIATAISFIGLMRYVIFISRGSKAILKREEICYFNNILVKIWGSLYNLAIFIIITNMFLVVYLAPIKEYGRTGNVVALYCGVIFVISFCLLEVDSIVKRINIQRRKSWDIIFNLARGCLILSIIFFWISRIFLK